MAFFAALPGLASVLAPEAAAGAAGAGAAGAGGLAGAAGGLAPAAGAAAPAAGGGLQMPGVAIQRPGAPSTPGQAGIPASPASGAHTLTPQQKALADSFKRPGEMPTDGYTPTVFQQVGEGHYQPMVNYQNLSHLMQGQ